QKARPLQHTVNDVRQLAQTLRVRDGFEPDSIYEITDAAKDKSSRPLKESLLAGLPRWFEKPGPKDGLIVYFSGHGIRDRSGKLYLVPLDGDPADPTATMIPLEWFRR